MGFRMHVPTKLIFGQGTLNKLHRQSLPGKKALLVISNGKSTRANGYLQRTEEQLQKAGIESIVFDRVEANPLRSTVMAGAEEARKHSCDFVLALGGGSVMDAAKIIAMMVPLSGDLWDYVASGTGKNQPPEAKPLPLVCIPTTAGTGSEADPWGVITNDETNEKVDCGGTTGSYPVLAIIDPELMTSVPPLFTAYQGFDALFHSTECFIANTANLISDMYALTSIENIGKYLVRAVKNGNDMEAREHMAFASTLSGIVMTLSCCTSEHSMEHAMSAYHQELPHGAGLIMISKAYYEYFIEKHVCDERFIRMAQALGMKDADKPEDFITALVKLQEECGVADLKMSDYGIVPEELDKIAANARETMGALFPADPFPMNHEDCVSIYQKAYK